MMEFRNYAAKEAAASVQRVLARSSEASRKQLEAVQKALEAAAAALASTAPGAADEKEAYELVERLAGAAASATDKAVKKVTDEAQKAADAIRAELDAAGKQKMALTASLKEAQAQAETLRGELKSATERGEVAARQIAEATKASQKLQSKCDELSAAREEEAKGRSLVEADLRKTREALEAARAEAAAASALLLQTANERAALEEAVSVANSQSEAAEAKLDAVTDLFKQSSARVKALERAQQDHERIVREMEARLKAAPAAAAAAAPAASSAPVALLDDLIAAFQALGTATSISDVLTTLVEQLAAQYPRVALFRVKKSHLQGEHQIGFDLKTDIGKVVIPLGMDSLLARAAASGAIERLSGEELKDSNRAPFSGAPACALAIPVVVAGETLAIVYADDVGAPRQKRTPDAEVAQVRVAEAMQQHAVALLMRMTNELKVRAELQAYVRSLFHELEQMYSSDVQAGKADADLRSRLKGNLDYARTIFESRVALEGGDATAMLDDELAAMIEAQPDTPFSRDLAAVTGRPEAAARKRDAAEAS